MIFGTIFDQGADRWAMQEKLEAFRAKYRKDQMTIPFTETILRTKFLHALNQWRDELEGIPLSEATGLRGRSEFPIDGAEILIDHAGL